MYRQYDPYMPFDVTEKFEPTLYSAALPVTGAKRGSNRQKLYDALG